MATIEMRCCLICKEMFVSSRKDQAYCSKKCNKKAWKKRNRQNNADLMRRGNRFTTDQGYSDRVTAFSSRLEYVGNNGSDYLYVLCKDCGSVFQKSKESFKPSHRGCVQCPKCEGILLEKIRREKNEAEAVKQKERQRKLEIKEAEAKAKAEARIKTYICERCGEQFRSDRVKKYCSDLCARRQADANKEYRRRTRKNAQFKDNISLEVLAKRDKNRCWICGKKVNWHDFKTRSDGAFLARDNYPSIDHVKPLSRGGSHTWENVRLAHRGCNTKKSASLTITEADGQLMMIL